MAETVQRIFPFLYVDDVSSYLTFLTRAYGFETRRHEVDPTDHEHEHAETALGDTVVMLGHASPKWSTAAPRRLAGLHAGLYVLVNDVDAHCQRARAAGATIEAEPENRPWGHRMYIARDPEGHQWYFAAPQSSAAGK